MTVKSGWNPEEAKVQPFSLAFLLERVGIQARPVMKQQNDIYAQVERYKDSPDVIMNCILLPREDMGHGCPVRFSEKHSILLGY